MSFPGIYRITCLVNGKSYIGQARSIATRVSAHRKSRNSRPSGKSILYRSMRKHGLSAFVVDVVERVDDLSSLNDRERFWIDRCGSLTPGGYNIVKDPDNRGGWKKSPEAIEKTASAHRGRRRTSETCCRISEAKKGKPVPPAVVEARRVAMLGRKRGPMPDSVKKKISEARKGHVVPPEVRKKISESGRGRRHTPQARAKISASKKGYKWSEGAKRKFSESRKGVKLGPRRKKTT
jgi:group I intron endonuclease